MTRNEVREDGALICVEGDHKAFDAEQANKLLGHLSAFINGEYGGRCREWDPDCPKCKLWFAHDQIKGVLNEAQ